MEPQDHKIPDANPAPRRNVGERGRIIGSAQIISGCIFLSRLLGFVRDMLCAGFFGVVGDAFFLAFIIPNLFRRLFGEGALSAAFIPTFSDYLKNKTNEETFRFISTVITLLVSFLSLVTLSIMAVSFLFPVLFPSPEAPEFTPLFSKLLRIMLPYLPLICLVALLTAILNSLKHFTMPALASVVLNISWIAGFLIAPVFTPEPEGQVVVMAWAIIIGGVLEILIQIPPLLKKKIKYTPRFDLKHPGVKELLRLMIPVVFGLAVFQINLLFDNIIAQAFVPGGGAISALYFGNRVMQFPLAIIGISLATAVFPYLAEAIVRQDTSGMKLELNRSLRLSNLVAIPASIGLVILAVPMVDLAFGILPRVTALKGFTAGTTLRTAQVLAFYGLGIWAYCGLQIINRAFYALKDMKTPVKVGVWMVLVNIVANIILVQFLAESGIALATALNAIANFFILLVILQKRIGKLGGPDFAASFLKSLVISILMGGVCLGMIFVLPETTGGMAVSTLFWTGLVRVLIPVLAGIFFYLALTRLFRWGECREIWGKQDADKRRLSG